MKKMKQNEIEEKRDERITERFWRRQMDAFNTTVGCDVTVSVK